MRELCVGYVVKQAYTLSNMFRPNTYQKAHFICTAILVLLIYRLIICTILITI